MATINNGTLENPVNPTSTFPASTNSTLDSSLLNTTASLPTKISPPQLQQTSTPKIPPPPQIQQTSTTKIPSPPSPPQLQQTSTPKIPPAPQLQQTSTSTPFVQVPTQSEQNSTTTGSTLCPSLLSDNNTDPTKKDSGQTIFEKTSTGNSVFKVHLSSRERQAGTVVVVECEPRADSQRVIYLKCLQTGQWNGTVLNCVDHLDITSFKMYFVVAGIVSGLSVVVLLTLLCFILMTKRSKSSSSSECSGESEKNIYMNPYEVNDVAARSAPGKQTPSREISYDRPVVYSWVVD